MTEWSVFIYVRRSTAFDLLYQPGAEHYADFNVDFRTWFDMYHRVDVPF